MDDRPCLADRLAPWLGAAVVLTAIVVVVRTLLYGYILDDTTVIRSNPLVQSWRGLATAWTHPYWAEQGGATRSGLYRPLLIALFTVIWNAGHRFALWFHLFSVLAHAVASWLVWRLLRRAVGPWVAFAGALWFAVHPVHVEAIASAANVSEVLVAIAAVWLAFVVRRAADDLNAGAAVGWRAAAGMAALFVAASLIKESGFVLPALAAVWAWGWRWPDAALARRQPPSTAVREWRRPLILGALALMGIFLLRRAVIGHAVGSAAMVAPGLEGLGPWQRTWAVLSLAPRVVTLLFWPQQLLPHYGPEALRATGPSIAGASALVVLVAAAALGWVLARRGDRRPLAALAWMCIAFLPASNLLVPTGQILAERTLYVASIGAAMLVAWLAAAAIAVSRAMALAPRRTVCWGVSLAIGIAVWRGAFYAVDYAGEWRSHDELFHYLVAADPAGYRGHWLLALQAQAASHPDSALRELGRAYARFRDDRQLTIDYTDALLAAGRPANAAAVASNLMRFPDLRADSNAVGLYLSAVAGAYGADSARALAGTLAPGIRRGAP
jgi:hypothetical protein